MKNPIQPLAIDHRGVLRFKKNEIVCFMLDFLEKHSVTLNELADHNFCDDDWEQFAQLIGYSLDGFASLGYASEATLEAAIKMHETKKSEQDCRLDFFENKLNIFKEKIKNPIAELFDIHPDNLDDRC